MGYMLRNGTNHYLLDRTSINIRNGFQRLFQKPQIKQYEGQWDLRIT